MLAVEFDFLPATSLITLELLGNLPKGYLARILAFPFMLVEDLKGPSNETVRDRRGGHPLCSCWLFEMAGLFLSLSHA